MITLGVFVIGLSLTGFSQTSETEQMGFARMDNLHHISIAGNQVLPAYRINVQHFSFQDEADAQNHFDALGLNHVEFEAEGTTTVVMRVDLDSEQTGEWTTEQWKEYLQTGASN